MNKALDRKKLADFFSLLFHPSAVAIYLFGSATFFTQGEIYVRIAWALLAIFFSALMPALVVLGLLKMGLLSDADISNRAERVRPYILITFFYFLGSFLLLHFPPHPINKVYGTLMSCYATVTLVGTIITYFWKISMHLAGLAGPLTAAIFFWKLPAVPFLISLLPLSWARLYLRKHNIWQVLAGIMMSSLVTYLTCYFLT
ncbi:hypothetical protein H5T88_00105 [bacterium]|nr:hypothetical protein [bacterium]